MKKYSGIYGIYCTVNNKWYVGSSKDVNRRWSKHRTDLKFNKHHNQHLQAAYNLYGVQAFSYIKLEECESNTDVLIELETKWCIHFQAHLNDKGFSTGLPNNIRTRELTENKTIRVNKIVLCLSKETKEIVYKGDYIEVANKFQLSSERVKDITNYWKTKQGRRKSYKDYIFVYEEDYDPNFDYSNYKHERALESRYSKSIYVYKADSDYKEQFKSIRECCEKLNLEYHKLYHTLRTKKFQYEEYLFKYNN